MSDFSYDVLKDFGTISESSNGWKKKLKLISWNGRPEKYDIREWSEDDLKMSKGVTFSKDEFKILKDMIEGIEL